jgi:neurofilament heavy polypeptide
MDGSRVSAALGTVLACFALNAMAQATTATTDPKKSPPADAKKAEPRKADPKKAPPAKAPPKKAADPKKADPKKAPPKKADEKAQRTSQGGTVQKYQAGKAPDLKDSKGNTIPTSPEAYDISSATAKKK